MQLQESVDYGINIQLKHRLNVFLMLMGVVGLVAVAMSAIGLLAEDASLVTSSSTQLGAEERTVATEFVGYANWNAFTVTYAVVEKWICANINFSTEASKMSA